MPKGTTARTRKILEQQQAAKGTGPGGERGAQAVFPFCCIWQGGSRPAGTGPEAGSDGVQGALDQGDSDGDHSRGGRITASVLLSCS